MNKILIIIAALLVALGAGLHGDPVSAEGNGNKCAEYNVPKVETTGDPLTVTITAPEGQLIAKVCIKAGSANQGDGPEYTTYDPPVPSVTIGHSSGHAVSHYTYKLVDKPTPPTDPTVPPTDPTTPPTEPTEPTTPPTEPTVPETEPSTIPTTVPETDAPTTVVTTPETDAPTTTVADTTTVAPETSIDTPPTTAVVETVVVPARPQPIPAPAPEITPDELPATGGESTTALYAGALLLAGLGAVLVARRRQTA
jgi:LPXTG-motif cell wall-anchored protein